VNFQTPIFEFILSHKKPEAFTAEEEERLMEVLGLNSLQLKDVIEISSFIFEQSAYVQVCGVVELMLWCCILL
jgi:hypothetical protein